MNAHYLLPSSTTCYLLPSSTNCYLLLATCHLPFSASPQAIASAGSTARWRSSAATPKPLCVPGGSTSHCVAPQSSTGTPRSLSAYAAGKRRGSGLGQLALRRPLISARPCSRLPRASASIGQSAACFGQSAARAASPLAGHAGLLFHAASAQSRSRPSTPNQARQAA